MRWLRALAVLALLLAVAVGAAAWLAHRRLMSPFRAYAGDETTVRIESGTDAGSILLQLEREGIIADARLARVYLRYAADGASLKAG